MGFHKTVYMKIIKDKYNRYPMNVVCKKCESEIQLESGLDVLVHKAIQSPMFIAESRPYIYQWMCPLCKELNEINW